MDFTVYEYNYILKLIYNEHQNLIRCHADADTLKFISDIEFKLRNIVNAQLLCNLYNIICQLLISYMMTYLLIKNTNQYNIKLY